MKSLSAQCVHSSSTCGSIDSPLPIRDPSHTSLSVNRQVLGFVSGEGAEMRAALTAAAQKHSALKFVIVDAAANEQALKVGGLLL